MQENENHTTYQASKARERMRERHTNFMSSLRIHITLEKGKNENENENEKKAQKKDSTQINNHSTLTHIFRKIQRGHQWQGKN